MAGRLAINLSLPLWGFEQLSFIWEAELPPSHLFPLEQRKNTSNNHFQIAFALDFLAEGKGGICFLAETKLFEAQEREREVD